MVSGGNGRGKSLGAIFQTRGECEKAVWRLLGPCSSLLRMREQNCSGSPGFAPKMRKRKERSPQKHIVARRLAEREDGTVGPWRCAQRGTNTRPRHARAAVLPRSFRHSSFPRTSVWVEGKRHVETQVVTSCHCALVKGASIAVEEPLQG